MMIAWEEEFKGDNAFGSKGSLLWFDKTGGAEVYDIVSGGSAINKKVIGRNSRIPSGVWSPSLNGNNTLPAMINGKVTYPNSSLSANSFTRHGVSFKFNIPTPGTGRSAILFHPTPNYTQGCVGLCGSASQLISFRDRFLSHRGPHPKLFVP